MRCRDAAISWVCTPSNQRESNPSARCAQPEAGVLPFVVCMPERTCADQAESRDRDHHALTSRVAQLEASIEIWAQEMSTGVKAERTRSAALLRAGSVADASPVSLPPSPGAATRKALSLQALKSGLAEDIAQEGAVFAAATSGVRAPGLNLPIPESDPASPASPHHRLACGDTGTPTGSQRLGAGGNASPVIRPDEAGAA